MEKSRILSFSGDLSGDLGDPGGGAAPQGFPPPPLDQNVDRNVVDVPMEVAYPIAVDRASNAVDRASSAKLPNGSLVHPGGLVSDGSSSSSLSSSLVATDVSSMVVDESSVDTQKIDFNLAVSLPSSPTSTRDVSMPNPSIVVANRLGFLHSATTHGDALLPQSSVTGVSPSSVIADPTRNSLSLPAKSWIDTVRGHLNSTEENFKLHYIAPQLFDQRPMAFFSNVLLEKGAKAWVNTIVLHIVGIRPSFHRLSNFVHRVWQPKGSVQVYSRENGFFLVQFALAEDCDRVVQGGPWLFDRRFIILKRWTPDIKFEREVLKIVPTWIRLPGLPIQFWNNEGISRIASLIGNPLFMDEATAKRQRLAFARVFLEISSLFPIKKEVNVRLENGTVLTLPVEFEWIPPICDICRSFGHLSKQCSTHKEWIPVNKRKSSDAVMVGEGGDPAFQSILPSLGTSLRAGTNSPSPNGEHPSYAPCAAKGSSPSILNVEDPLQARGSNSSNLHSSQQVPAPGQQSPKSTNHPHGRETTVFGRASLHHSPGGPAALFSNSIPLHHNSFTVLDNEDSSTEHLAQVRHSLDESPSSVQAQSTDPSHVQASVSHCADELDSQTYKFTIPNDKWLLKVSQNQTFKNNGKKGQRSSSRITRGRASKGT